MCAIAGIIFFKTGNILSRPSDETFQDIFKNLLTGLHFGGSSASGIFIADTPEDATKQGTIFMHKNPVRSDVLAKEQPVKKAINHISAKRTAYAIAHARAATNGAASNNYNNHPFLSGSIIGIHNGVISNDEDIIAAKKLSMSGCCDSEVIFRLMDSHSTAYLTQYVVTETCKALRGWYACAATSVKDYKKLVLFRNREPIELRYNSKTGTLLFCSQDFLMKDALEAAGEKIEDYAAETFPEESGVIIDTEVHQGWYTPRHTIFALPGEKSSSAGYNSHHHW